MSRRTSPGTDRRSRRRWSAHVLPLIASAVALAGMLVLLYPSVASWFSQYNQSKMIEDYSHQIEQGVEPSAAQQLRLARAYNAALSSGALLQPNHRLPTGKGTSTDSWLDYNRMLRADNTGMMGRLRIPAIDVDLPIYHGTSDATLLKGVGHLEGTSLPVGGAGTHAVLTAHRGLASSTLFTHLNEVKVGDTFSISVMGEVLTYKVITTKVVDPDQTASLRPVAGKDLVTLVTCTPLGINSQRILVTGQRVYPTPAADIKAAHGSPSLPHFPWWAVVLGGGLMVIGLYVWWSGLVPRSSTPSGAGGTEPDRGGDT